jgi:DNA-binding CsgD family transcriptional regulator
MYTAELEKLARYLMSPGLTVPEVCKFLIFETFASLKPSAIYMTEITEDGCLAPVGFFGLNQKTIQGWGNIPLTEDLPFTRAAKSDVLLLVEPKEVLDEYPSLENFSGIPVNWDSHLICPVLPFGVFSLTLNSVPAMHSEFESFIRAAGALAALHLMRANFRIETFNRKNQKTGEQRTGFLTDRQLMIKKLMEKGYSNPAIAAEIGYSESLVRQETMAIYSTLNISGRKELLEDKPE